MAPHRHLVIDVTATSARTHTNTLRISVLVSHSRASFYWEVNMANLMRTSALPLYLASLQSVHDYYPFDVEDGGRLAPELVDRMDILVAVCRFLGTDAA
jgi:hypothetical protein